jgi:hypothetical protein
MHLVLIPIAAVADSMLWFVFGKRPEAPRIEDNPQLQCVAATDISQDARKNLAKLQNGTYNPWYSVTQILHAM